jgi:hypothetical protein
MLPPRRAVALLAVLISVLISVNGCKSAPTTVGADVSGIPQGWVGFPTNSSQVGLTREFTHGGSFALSITGRVYANVSQHVLATSFRGQRVRWSGWMKGTGITNAITSGLWMRVDDGQTTLAFDNMYDRPFAGTSDWTQVTVVLDVPQNAIGITLGVIFNADGRLIVDDLALQIVGLNVPATTTITPFAFNTAALYENAPIRPVNLDFEGTPAGLIRQAP